MVMANVDYIWYASPNAEALAEYPAYYEEQYGEPLDEEIYNIMASTNQLLPSSGMTKARSSLFSSIVR